MLLIVIAAAGAGLGAAAIYSDFHTSAEVRAYQSAGTCAAAADSLSTDTCRYLGQATVTGTSQHDHLSVNLSVDSLPGHTFTATFPISREPASSSLSAGATAPAEVWNGQVTEFAGVKSAQDPEFMPQGLALGGVGLVVAGLGLIAWGVFLARRAWRR